VRAVRGLPTRTTCRPIHVRSEASISNQQRPPVLACRRFLDLFTLFSLSVLSLSSSELSRRFRQCSSSSVLSDRFREFRVTSARLFLLLLFSMWSASPSELSPSLARRARARFFRFSFRFFFPKILELMLKQR